MRPEHLAEIAAAVIRKNGGQVTPYALREMNRIIASDIARRERFIQKVKAPAFEWKKPLPRR
jgi:hypothetical protein